MTNRDWKTFGTEVIAFTHAIGKIDDEDIIVLISDHIREVFELWNESFFKTELEKFDHIEVKDFASYVEYGTRVSFNVDAESAGLLLLDDGTCQ